METPAGRILGTIEDIKGLSILHATYIHRVFTLGWTLNVLRLYFLANDRVVTPTCRAGGHGWLIAKEWSSDVHVGLDGGPLMMELAVDHQW